MKKALLLILSVLVLCATAYADITVTDLSLGGTGQERGENATGTITVKNTGTADVTINTITNDANSKYKVIFDATTFTLAAGASKQVTVQAYIPTDFNAVDSNLKETKFQVGTTTVTGTEGTTTLTKTSKLELQAANKLKIRKGKAVIKGVTTFSDSFRDNGKIDDLKPGDNVDFEITVENNFPKSGSKETDFDDVTVSFKLSDDSDFDVDEDEDDFSIRSNDEEIAKLSLDIVDDARGKSHTMTINAVAIDENGARHGAVMTVTLSVERDAHDLVFKKATLSPSRLICGSSRTVTFNGQILNRGRLDEDEVVVELRVGDLGIVERTNSVEINEDDTENVKLPFTVKEGVHGAFTVDLLTLYDTSKESNVQQLTLTIDECKKEEVKIPAPVTPSAPVPEPVTPVVQVPPGVVTQPGQATTQAVPAAKVSSLAFRESDNYMMVLAVAVAVLFVLVIALLAVLLKRR